MRVSKLFYFVQPVLRRNIRSSHSLFVSNNNLIIKHGVSEEQYPLIWLRDNCQCDKCFHQNSQSRVINWYEFNIDVKANTVIKDGENVKVVWDDGHESVFTNKWLKERSFQQENQKKYLSQMYKLPKVLWNKKDFKSVLNYYSYTEVMKNERKLYYWLKDLATKGVVLMDGAPLEENEIGNLSEKVAFKRKTHYGEDFHVISKPNTSNVAYLSGISLQLHTDLPYYRYKPGVILLHCLAQTTSVGGESLLSDAFYIAEKLRKENREIFDVLSQVEINWSDIGEEDGVKYHKIYRAPVISLDSQGEIDMIRYSTPQRDSFMTTSIENVSLWYRALRLFVNMIIEEHIQLKLKPGQVLAFDNTRMLHGREKYEDVTNGYRHLVGNYLDWDEIYSKMRVLKKEFKL